VNNYSIKAGSTDVSVVLRIIDSTDGTPETGVVYNTSGIDLEYRREGAASVDITEATLSALTDSHSDGGFLHIGNGYYRLDLPDAAVAGGAAGVLIHGTVTGMVVIGAYIQLVAYDPLDAVRLGLTALPNAAAEAAGGLYTRGSGAGQINQAANGMIDANVVRNANTAIVSASGRQEVNVSHFGGSAGTFSGGRPEVNASHAAGTAWNSGAIGAATLATDTITAAKIAADAIGASELAADAVTEIQSGLATSSALSSLQADVTTLLGRITSTLFSGITSLAQWLGLLAGKQTGNSTARTELRATGAGSGTFDETTDSAEALRDRGDAAWTTATGFSTLDAAGVRTAVGLASANLDTQLDALPTNAELATALGTADDATLAAIAALSIPSAGTIADAVWDEALAGHATGGSAGAALSAANAPTAAAVADAVWDEAIAGHAISGSTGEALAAAGGAGDPWITALPGSYSAGQAGYIVGTNLNATVSSRATQTSVDTIDDFLDTEVAAIKAKTDNLPAAPAAVGDIPTATQNADALLKRDWTSVTGEAARSVLNALRFLRNKWTLTGTTLSVKEEDDTTEAWTAEVSTTAGADPITGSDPA